MTGQMPENVPQRVTPERVMRALAMFRARYDHGLIPVAEFKLLVASFQFVDELGRYWSPGANSGRWYHWDRTAWAADEPPATLLVGDLPFTHTAEWVSTQDPVPAPPVPTGPRCSCGAVLSPSSQFCPNCGSRIAPDPPQVRCSNPACGAAIPAGKKFCAKCGQPAAVASAPQPPAPLRCSKCGRTVPPGKKFCPGCGAPAPQGHR
jgi:RNA polymerase subunit RPABC4/transcription elongation factor Spt4